MDDLIIYFIIPVGNDIYNDSLYSWLTDTARKPMYWLSKGKDIFKKYFLTKANSKQEENMFGIKTRLFNVVADYLIHNGYGSKNVKKRVIDVEIQENASLMNSHIGERCFVLGNGPSLNNIDLELLQNETVFTVNSFYKVPGADKVRTKYHFILDAAYFDMLTDCKLKKGVIKEVLSETSKICDEFFIPFAAKDYIKINEFDKYWKFNYLYTDNPYLSSDCVEMDLMGSFPSFTTVVQVAIAVAICMGFSEIYVAGIDSTLVFDILESKMTGDFDEGAHAYKSSYKYDYTTIPNTVDILYDQYIVFRGYSYLSDYCKRKGIKLYNCSDVTLVDSIDKMKFNDIFKL